MAIILDGTNGITYPDNSIQARSIANTSNILATIGPKGVTTGYLGNGAVLQVVQATYSTYATTSGATFLDTGLTATITPSSATSKILVLVQQAGECYSSNATDLGLRLVRGSTTVWTTNFAFGDNTNAANDLTNQIPIIYLDSPGTTSPTTYKTQFGAPQNVGGSYGNYVGVQNASATSTITLLEIAA